jgi:hypothetical protein
LKLSAFILPVKNSIWYRGDGQSCQVLRLISFTIFAVARHVP